MRSLLEPYNQLKLQFQTYRAFRFAFCLSSSKYFSFFSLHVPGSEVGSIVTPSGRGNGGNSSGFFESAGSGSDWDGVGIGIVGFDDDEDDSPEDGGVE